MNICRDDTLCELCQEITKSDDTASRKTGACACVIPGWHPNRGPFVWLIFTQSSGLIERLLQSLKTTLCTLARVIWQTGNSSSSALKNTLILQSVPRAIIRCACSSLFEEQCNTSCFVDSWVQCSLTLIISTHDCVDMTKLREDATV